LDGAYSKFKTGKDTNQVGLSCVGRTLTLFINGNQIKQFDDNQYVLKKGKIGISASSFNDPPAVIGFDWVKVSQP
jgi:glutaredoxin-related protein